MDNHMDNNPNGNRPDNNKGPGRQDPNKNHQSILAFLVCLLVTLVCFAMFTNMLKDNSSEITYDKFIEMVDDGDVKEVTLQSNTLTITPKHQSSGFSEEVYYANQMESVDKLTERLEGTGIKFEYKKPDAAGEIISMLVSVLLPTILLAGIRKKGTFRITDKKTEQGKNSSVGYALPYLAGVLLCMIAIVRLAGLSAREQTLTYSVILFWLCLNLYFQLLACYVAVGRERKADYTMQALTMQGSLKGEKEICTVTCEGFSDTTVLLKRKGGIREQKGELILGRSNLVLPVFKKETPGEQQESELTEERAYIFEIDPSRWQEKQKKSYLEFLYDRTPLLPQQLQRKGYLDESVTALFYHLTEE